MFVPVRMHSLLSNFVYACLMLALLAGVVFADMDHPAEPTTTSPLTESELAWMRANPKIVLGDRRIEHPTSAPFSGFSGETKKEREPLFFRVGHLLSQPPLVFPSQFEAPGLIADYLHYLGGKRGLKPQMQLFPNLQAMHAALQNGDIDAIVQIGGIEANRHLQYPLTEPFLEMPVVIAIRNDHRFVAEVYELHDEKVAIPATSPLIEVLVSRYPEVQFVPVKDCYEGLRGVSDTTFGALICNLNVVGYQIRNMGLNHIKISAITPYKIEARLMVGEEKKALLGAINQAISEMDHEDKLKLKDKWHHVDEEYFHDLKRYFIWVFAIVVVLALLLAWITRWNRKLRRAVAQKESLAMNLRQYEMIVSASDDLMAFIDDGLIYQTVNKSYLDFFKLKREQVIGKHVKDVIGEERFKIVSPLQQRCLEGEVVKYESPANSPRHGKRFLERNYFPYRDANGRVTGFVYIARDRTQDQINETGWNRFFELPLQLVMIADFESFIVRVNPGWTTLLGYEAEELIGKSFMQFIHPDDKESTLKEASRLAGGVQSLSFQNRYRCKDGSYRILSWTGTADEESRLFYAIAQDVTEQVRAQQKLKESEERFRMYTTEAPFGIFIVNPESYFVFTNEEGLRIIGYTLGELQEIRAFEIHPHDEVEKITGHMDRLFAKKRQPRIETRIVRKEGEIIEVTIDSIVLPNGNIMNYVQDVTEKAKAKQQLREQEEMMLTQSRQAAMGEMISMIAHQWRQPLSVIGMAANNIRLSVEMNSLSQEDLVETLDEVDSQVEHMSRTIDDFKDFFKPEKNREETNIVTLMLSAYKMIHASYVNAGITLDFINNCQGESVMQVYSRELMQVMINLLNNAKDAMENLERDKRVEFVLSQVDEAYVIEIKDNGTGIPESIRQKIFEPYFTTKGKLSGTGLGLYICKSIIEKHMGGTIQYKELPQGANFVLYLPIHPSSGNNNKPSLTEGAIHE